MSVFDADMGVNQIQNPMALCIASNNLNDQPMLRFTNQAIGDGPPHFDPMTFGVLAEHMDGYSPLAPCQTFLHLPGSLLTIQRKNKVPEPQVVQGRNIASKTLSECLVGLEDQP